MKFGNINAGYMLLSVVGLSLFYFWVSKKRKRLKEIFAERGLLNILLSSANIAAQRQKAILITGGIFLCVLSLMRPEWGFHWEKVKRRGLDIIIAIDTSKSMLAEDVKPNRLERAKLAVKDMIKKLRGDRIGLAAFAGSAFLQSPLTVDYNGFILSLDSLATDTIPKGGTSLSSAIREAIKGYEGKEKKYKVLVIITDGETHEGDPVKAAEEAKDAGIKIFCIGIGTKEGELIPVRDERGNKVFLKDSRGNVVKSRLDETTLKKIALSTGGSYVRSTAKEFGLALIYRERLSKMEKKDIENKMVKHYEERFQLPLALALIFLLAEMFVNERKREKRNHAEDGGGRKRGFLKWIWGNRSFIWVLIVMSGLLITSEALAASTKKILNKANGLYREGKYGDAIKRYNEILSNDPDSPIANFNAGAAYYKQGDYKKAEEFFLKALTTEDRELEVMANYNMGNSKYREAMLKKDKEPHEAADLLKESLDYYKRAIELNRDDKDAKFNHEFTEKSLKILLDKLKNMEKKEGESDKKDKPEENRGKKERKEQADSSKREDKKKKGDGKKQAGDTPRGANDKKEPEDTKTRQKKEEAGQKGDKEVKEMSEDEARMLLEGYMQEEESEKRLKFEKREGYYPEVLKDW
ncbi:MAG: VWA domain-containing protein [Nitrospirota bacterium]